MRNVFLVLALIVAGCSATSSPMGQTLPPAPNEATANSVERPSIQCPVSGKTYVSGKASTVFATRMEFFDVTQTFEWMVTFKNQSAKKAPVTYVPQISTCGPANGKKPFGTIKSMGQTSVMSTCQHGVCTVTATYSLSYTPKKVKNRFHHAVWLYDLINFVPSSNTGYGTLPGFRIEVGPPPA